MQKKYFKDKKYSDYINIIGIVPIVAPEEEIAKGLWKEIKKVEIKYGFASVSLRINYSTYINSTIEKKKGLVIDNILKSIKAIKGRAKIDYKMFENDILISERTKIFVPDRDLKLKPNTIKKSVSYENGELKIKLISPVFCRSVMVDIPDFCIPFSDNYFDLLPNEEKNITVKADKKYDVTVKSLADVPVKASKLKVSIFRTKFFFEPENLANWFYYTVN